MKELLELLPRELNYGESPEMTAIQAALSAAVGDVWAARDGFAAQLSPATATWGLSKWEEALGLVPSDRNGLDARRRAVIAKLRGAGTSTVERLTSVAEAHLGGVVWLLEFPDEYRVEVWVRSRAVPDGSIEALRGALKEIMPAHLRWSCGVEYPTEPFVNEPDAFTLHRFILVIAFSDRRTFVSFRLDGSVLLDGSALLDAVPQSMFAFPRVKLGARMARNRQRLAAALTTDSLWTLDGSVPLDGSRKLNAGIVKEEL